MKKTTAIFTSLLLVFLLAGGVMATSKYDVTEPITISWWHSHGDHYSETIKEMVDKFNSENPLITVEPIYVGSYTDINSQLIASIAAENAPALCVANTSYPAGYGAAGICEILDPYIAAYDFDIADFGEGLIASTSYDGEQIALPYLISTQVLFYDKTAAKAEGVVFPTTFDELGPFLEKTTIFNPDGTTKRYGTVFGGWDYWYFETLYKNNGVQLVLEDGLSTDINSDMSIYITTKMKEWIDKGYAYFAYGTGASSSMRQLFFDGGAFSVFHTSSLYDFYSDNIPDAVELGIAWLPGGNDGESFLSEVGGATILIPAHASQKQKNAAWQFMMFLASPENNLFWADKSGYFPTRRSVEGTQAYAEYLERKPAMEAVVSMSEWINPRNQHPAYDTCANAWRDALARIFNEGAPVKQTLDELAKDVEEILGDS